MTMIDFWRKWRAELLRGSVIFVAVVAVGLALISAVRSGADKVRNRARDFIPQLAQGFTSGLGGNFDDPGRNHGATWSWHSKLNPGQTLTLRDLNGPVEVTPAPGTETVVTAERSWLTSDPNSVTIQAVPTSSGTMICAIWPGSNGTECTAGHDVNFRFDGKQHNDVAVKFLVQLPRGVKIDVGSVNGDVDVSGAQGGVTVNTVNGDLSVQTSAWPVNLTTVNGDITATAGAPGPESASVKSVNGDVSLSLPEHLNLVVKAHSVTGDISNDFSIPVTEPKYGPSHSMSGTLGTGGGVLDINTVSGDITLSKATASSVHVWSVKKHHGVAVVAPAAPAAPAPVAAPPHPPR